MQRDVYWRRCRFLRAVDGDTVDCEIDLGFFLTTTHRLRLLGINTPEVHDPDPILRAQAAAATAFTAKWFIDHVFHGTPSSWPFNLRTEKSDAFGRYLAFVECLEGHSLTDDLLASGLAVVYTR